MKKLLLLLFLISTVAYSAVVYYGDGAAVFIENVLKFEQSGTEINATEDRLLYTDTSGVSNYIGPNPDKLNLITDPSFEVGISSVTCTGCTASQSTSIKLGTVENTASLQAAFSASTGSPFEDFTTGSEYLGVQGKLSIWLKTDQSGVVVYPRCDGADISSLSVNVASDNKWHLYEIPFVMCSTSNGWKVEATTSITGNVYADDVFVGASDARTNIGVNTPWTAYTPTITGFGSAVVTSARWRRVGDSLEFEGRYTPGTPTATEAQITLPDGLIISDIYTEVFPVGEVQRAANAEASYTTLATSGDTFLNIGVRGGGSSQAFSPQNGSTLVNAGENMSFWAKVKIANWSASTDIYTTQDQFQTQTKILSADLTATGTATDLTFTDLIVGGEYEVNLNCNIIAANGEANLNITHDSAIIGSCGITDTNTGRIGASVVSKFTATTTSLTFEFVELSGTAVLQGNGTQSETFVQLRRINKQITAQFKDVVTSPNSSNGKPVSFSCRFTNTGAIASGINCPWVSSSTNSGGNLTVGINAGICSTPPICTCSGYAGGNSACDGNGAPTSTSVTMTTFVASTGSIAALASSLMCDCEAP